MDKKMKCADCGKIFDVEDAAEHKEYHFELPGRPYESWLACPACGGVDLEEIDEDEEEEEDEDGTL